MAKSGPHFLRKLRKHFGADPAKLAVVSQRFNQYDRPNVHLALERLGKAPGYQLKLEGIIANDTWEHPSFARLARDTTSRRFLSGPVEHRDVEMAGGKQLACVAQGVFWVKHRTAPAAM